MVRILMLSSAKLVEEFGVISASNFVVIISTVSAGLVRIDNAGLRERWFVYWEK
jgi:hypothetical protein